MGYAVELKHDSTETTWESHGWVRVCTPEGEQLTGSDKVQHNSFYSRRVDTLIEMANEADSSYMGLASSA